MLGYIGYVRVDKLELDRCSIVVGIWISGVLKTRMDVAMGPGRRYL